MIKINRLMASAIIVLGMSSAAFSQIGDTTYVTNTNNTGAGSLRNAINIANSNPGFTFILYNIPVVAAPGPLTVGATSVTVPACVGDLSTYTGVVNAGKAVGTAMG